MTTYQDLQYEFPDRTVLRLSTQGGAAVEFIERHDTDAEGAAEHWFAPRDALSWEQLISRLRAADSWTPVTPAPAGLDALTELRGWFHAATAEGDAEAAEATERAAQALAVVLRIPTLSWTEVPVVDAVAADAQILIAESLAEPAADRRVWLRGATAWVRGRIWPVQVKAA